MAQYGIGVLESGKLVIEPYCDRPTPPIVCAFNAAVGKCDRCRYIVRCKESSCIGKNKARFVQNTSHVLAFYAFRCLVRHMKNTADEHMAKKPEYERLRNGLFGLVELSDMVQSAYLFLKYQTIL